ncbi:MAG: RDD family protein, partial [Ekhidna sp.]|nr:RDD family protein [Ekhidna sp.]
MASKKYAGFWLRFVAYIIDYIILYVINGFVILPILAAVGLSIGATSGGFNFNEMSDGDIIAMITAIASTIFAGGIIMIVIQILYYALMEASSYQGTVGKIALGLKVTDTSGSKLDLGKAIVRQVAKI